jgi:hypothetical protein
LLNLVANLDQQRAIGRIGDEAASVLERDIAALLSGRNGKARRKQMLEKTAVDEDVAPTTADAAA